MLDNTLTMTYSAESVTLVRVAEQNYSSTYRGQSAAGTEKFTLSVNHTIPQRGGNGESHLVRLDCEHYDADGIYVRTSSAWTVIKTFDAPQVDALSQSTFEGFQSILAISGLDSKIIGRES